MKFNAIAFAAVAVLFSVSAAPMAPNGEASDGTHSLEMPAFFRVLTALKYATGGQWCGPQGCCLWQTCAQYGGPAQCGYSGCCVRYNC
ncbi:hypothetical protein BG000_004650 [Podila horticola]|nr:hypothetical protein BG000_004650 [Podila horticola]